MSSNGFLSNNTKQDAHRFEQRLKKLCLNCHTLDLKENLLCFCCSQATAVKQDKMCCYNKSLQLLTLDHVTHGLLGLEELACFESG